MQNSSTEHRFYSIFAVIHETQPLVAIIVLSFVITGPIYDWRTQGKVHKVYLITLPLIIFILSPVVVAISQTSFWKQVVLLFI